MTTSFKPTRRGVIAGAAALAAAGTAPMRAFAQDYPSRPITMIVPWGAGGGTDACGRVIASLLERRLGQPVNVVNRTGGSGVVGHSAIATSAPDGYTLGVVTVEIAMMHHQGLTELTSTDFTPLGLMNADAPAITVRADSGWSTIGELVEAIKASAPGEMKATGTGQGGIWHLALVGWLQALGLEPNHVTWVPSEGAAPGMQDLIAGGVDLVPVSLGETKAMVDAGRAVNLAIMAEERLGTHPDVPTLMESDAGDFLIAVWRGICGPKDLPADVADKLSAALAEIAADPEYTEFMASRSFGVIHQPPAEHAATMAATDETMGVAMRAAGLVQG
ncbi:tripartite tricarboxylate transporter substrate binding protein [Szabonella alba]|uniref:Tripartite tricarboxylate transporter substrate binding protein n=1 Tax=Szabonella alba TaxID=2804194 RepID=A0A8K0VA05_9RHOB|nr:tripartite tricarboxylate transporter substrate binding protein [Szabonella alba]MBL4918068.1 tripartite tricarboxylate transporter substrate binding protein [Szabonella alba]